MKKKEFSMIPVYILMAFMVFLCVGVFYAVVQRDKEVNQAETECRKLGGYIETFSRSNLIYCWDRDGLKLLFQKNRPGKNSY